MWRQLIPDPAQAILRVFVASPWIAGLLLFYSLIVLYLALRLIRKPAPSAIAQALPHMASAPIILASAFTLAGFAYDTLYVSYHGLGVYVPSGVTVGALSLPVGITSYFVLMPLSLMARHRCFAVGMAKREGDV